MSDLMLYLLMSSADNLCKQFGPDQAWQNVGPDLDPNCLTLWWYSWKNYFKKLILKKSADDKKSMKNFPVGKDLIVGSGNKYYIFQFEQILLSLFISGLGIIWFCSDTIHVKMKDS